MQPRLAESRLLESLPAARPLYYLLELSYVLLSVSFAMKLILIRFVCCRVACRSRLDVVIAVDASSSVGEENFQRTLDFVRDVVSSLDVDSGNSRVSVLSFSDAVDMRFHLDEYTTYNDLANAISMHYR